MHIQIPPNSHSAGRPIIQRDDSNSDNTDTRITTFDCAKSTALFQAEGVSEKTGSSLHFTPGTKQLFGLSDIDPFDCTVSFTPLSASKFQFSELPQIDAGFFDDSEAGQIYFPPLTPSEAQTIHQFPSTGGKTIWPGMNGTFPADFGLSSTISSPTQITTASQSQYDVEESQSHNNHANSTPSPIGHHWSSCAIKTVPSTMMDTQMDDNNDGTQPEEVVSDSGSEYEDGNDSCESESESPLTPTYTPSRGKHFGHRSFGGKGPYYRGASGRQSG